MQTQSLFHVHSCLFDVNFPDEIRKNSVFSKLCNYYTTHYKGTQCKADLSDILLSSCHPES